MSACYAGDQGSIPELGRSPGEGNGNPLQYSCLENPKDGGAWQATVHGVAESDMTEHFHFLIFANGVKKETCLWQFQTSTIKKPAQFLKMI